MGVWAKIKNNKMILLLLLTGAVYFLLKFLVPLLAPILLAILFVTIFGPTMQGLQNHLRIPRQVAAVCLMLVAGGIVAILIWVLTSWLVSSLPGWLNSLEVVEQDLSGMIGQICAGIGRKLHLDVGYMEELLRSGLAQGVDYLQERLLPGVLSKSFAYVKRMAALGAFLATFLIATILLAKDYDKVMNKLLDREDCKVFLEILCGIIRYIATYVRAQVIIMSLIGGVCSLTLALCGFKQGAFWGLLAGVLDALPFIGTGVVLVPTALLQLFQASYGRALICIILYGVCILLRELLEPRLIGGRIGVSPIFILVSLYAGIGLFGVWGILLGPLGFVIVYQSFLSITGQYEKPAKG